MMKRNIKISLLLLFVSLFCVTKGTASTDEFKVKSKPMILSVKYNPNVPNKTSIILTASEFIDFIAYKKESKAGIQLMVDLNGIELGNFVQPIPLYKYPVTVIKPEFFPDLNMSRIIFGLKKDYDYEIIREGAERIIINFLLPEKKLQVIEDTLPDQKKKYTGKPISVDFEQADLVQVIRFLTDLSQKNVIISPNVSGKFSISFKKPLPWDQVLDIILDMQNLEMEEDENFIRILTHQEAMVKRSEKDEAARQKLALRNLEEESEEIITDIIKVSYTDIASLARHLRTLQGSQYTSEASSATAATTQGQASVQGQAQVSGNQTQNSANVQGSAEVQGQQSAVRTGAQSRTRSFRRTKSITYDSSTNQIIVTDTAKNIRKMKELAKMLDLQPNQISIEVRLVAINSSESNSLGFNWTVTGSLGDGLNNNLTSLTGTFGQLTATLTPATAFSAFATIDALQNKELAKVISNPKVITTDNQAASISTGQTRYVTQLDDAGNTVNEAVTATLSLTVTPHATLDRFVRLLLSVSNDSFASATSSNINTQTVSTQLYVKDGHTAVMGGVFKQTGSDTTDGVPGLSSIPLLGFLFENNSKASTDEELMIFVTPHIADTKK